MSQLSREWHSFTGNVTAGAASITVPAIPGVTHVLTSATFRLYGIAGHAAVIFLPSFVLAGVTIFPSGALVLPGLSGNESDSYEWSGKLTAGPNLPLVVAFANPCSAGIGELVDIAGYDV